MKHFQLKSKRKHLLYLFVAKTTPFGKATRQCLKSFKSWAPFCLSILYFPPNKFAGQILLNKWGNLDWDHNDNDNFHYVLTPQSFPFLGGQNSIFQQISSCCLLPTFHFSFQKIQSTLILLKREGERPIEVRHQASRLIYLTIFLRFNNMSSHSIQKVEFSFEVRLEI